MELTSISCGNCGAPLKLPKDAKFVTCNHCHSQLAVKHSDSITYTERLDKLDERTDRIEEEVSHLRYQSELTAVDRQWEKEREGYMITDKHGRRREPSVVGSVIIGVVFVLFGAFWMMRAPSPVAMLGIVVILIGVGSSIYSYIRAKDFLAAQSRYRRRKSKLRRTSRE